MLYDIAGVRGRYVSLGDGWTYLNAHQQPQIPETVMTGVSRAFRAAPRPVVDGAAGEGSSRHSRSGGAAMAGRLEGGAIVREARVAVADLVGATPDRVWLGPDLPSLYRDLAAAMSPIFRRGGSAVLSRLDPAELTAPFRAVAEETREAQPDLATGALPAWQFGDLVDGGTRLAAFAAATPELGTVAPVRGIVETVRSRSRSWVLVDASAYAPYRLVDIEDWGADVVGLDLQPLGGPPLAALVLRDAGMTRRLRALHPAAGAAPGDRAESVAHLEGRVPAGLAGGVAPLVDHLADLVEAAPGEGVSPPRGRRTRRDRLRDSMAGLSAYLDELGGDVVTFIGSLPTVHILGVSGEAAAGATVPRIPRLSFAVRGVPAATVHRRLLDNGLLTTITPTTPVLCDMGVEEVGGTVTVSLAPFNQGHDVEHLTRVLASLA